MARGLHGILAWHSATMVVSPLGGRVAVLSLVILMMSVCRLMPSVLMVMVLMLLIIVLVALMCWWVCSSLVDIVAVDVNLIGYC